MNKESINGEESLDVVEAFYKDKVDLKHIVQARKSVKKQTSFSLDPYTGPWEYAQKKHLLNRCLMGFSKRHLTDLENLSLEESLALLFTPEIADEPVNNYYFDLTPEAYREKYGVDDVGPGEPFINNTSTQRNQDGFYENDESRRKKAIDAWLYKRIYFQSTSIHWKLFYFFHNLLPTDGGTSIDNKGLYSYYKFLFDAAFANYKETIFNVTVNPAMLVYLNLGQSKKQTPDENFAREIQELFTVGKRPFSKFTESDVREIARLLVGWQVDYPSVFTEGPVVAKFDPINHDTGDKQFSEFYGNRLIHGRSGETAGSEELNDLIDMIFETDESAIYLSRRLYQFFVYPEITEEVENNIILPLAEIMKNNNFNLAATLKVLLGSEHFFDETLYKSMIKSPLEFVFGMVKEIDLFNGQLINNTQVNNPDYVLPEKFTDPISWTYYFFKNFKGILGNQGVAFGSPPNVSGWPAFYQAPVYDLFWINSVSIQNKAQITSNYTQWGMWLGNSVYIYMDHVGYLLSFENHDNLNALLDEMTDRLLGCPIPEQSRERIVKSVLGSLSETYWTEAVNEYKENPTQINRDNLTWRFKLILSQMFQLGEIHLF